MIVNGVIDNGQNVDVTLSIQEFKDLFILLDCLTNSHNMLASDDVTMRLLAKVAIMLDESGMAYHNTQEVYTLLHAMSITMQPLAFHIVSGRKEAETKAMKEPPIGPIQ